MGRFLSSSLCLCPSHNEEISPSSLCLCPSHNGEISPVVCVSALPTMGRFPSSSLC
ncbi:unnamed protein product, partial [Staurois parvus]